MGRHLVPPRGDSSTFGVGVVVEFKNQSSPFASCFIRRNRFDFALRGKSLKRYLPISQSFRDSVTRTVEWRDRSCVVIPTATLTNERIWAPLAIAASAY